MEDEEWTEDIAATGRTCGDDFLDKCPTTKKVTDKFKKLKKTSFKTKCQTSDDLLSGC
jgi:hypothetical protein